MCSQIPNGNLQDNVAKTIENFRDILISKDDRFAFLAQVDDDNRLKALVWTSGRSRALYKYFGDAITFDTTYETNVYKLTFGMFVSVSNHFESYLLEYY